MDFLKRFISPKNRGDGLSSAVSSFSELSDEQLETHLKIARYGSFILSDAVRPSYDLQVVPRTGFRHDTYSDVETGIAIPVLMASASREVVLDLFLDLLDPLDPLDLLDLPDRVGRLDLLGLLAPPAKMG